MKSASPPSHGRAVVLGASMAGLLAARALSETFDQVVVIDRDDLRVPGPRKGVPHGQHAHGILAKGHEIIEEFFPGLTADLTAAGAVPIDIHDDVVWYSGQNRLSGARSDLLGLSVSRPALEDYIRGRVRDLPNVHVRGGCTAIGLVADNAREVVTGVRLADDVEGGGAEEELSADLVVAATGRGNQAKTWLAELGYALPAEETIQVGIAYSTRQYVRSGLLSSGKTAIVTAMTPANPYGVVILPMEGDRWILTLFGIGADIPPTDPDGYDAFAHRLLISDLHEVVDHAEPLTAPRSFRIPASVRRRYETLRRMPDGYVVTGDALCAFNPVYGQGMTVAAAEATVLRDVVRESLGNVPRRFYAKAARVIDIPWDMAAGGDLAIPSSVGKRTVKIRILNRYVASVMRAAETDTVVSRVFHDVVNLAGRPERLFSPGVLRRVLFTGAPVPEATHRVMQRI